MAIVGLTAFRSPAAHHSGQLASPLQSGLCAGPGQRNLELPCGEGGPSWPMAHRKGDQKAAEGGQACRNRRKPPRRLWTPQHPQTKPHPASWNLPWLSRARGLHLPAVVPGRARCRRVVKAGSTEGPLPTGGLGGSRGLSGHSGADLLLQAEAEGHRPVEGAAPGGARAVSGWRGPAHRGCGERGQQEPQGTLEEPLHILGGSWVGNVCFLMDPVPRAPPSPSTW